jgi:diadenosine tetraphosphate (Ap4A) HIT family hydrolase
MTLLLADGEGDGQEILHVHLLVFPRYSGDVFGLKRGPRSLLPPGRDSLDTLAEHIKAVMSD